MSRELYNYKRKCLTAIKELLVEKEREMVNYYLTLARETQNEDELTKVMCEVRHQI